MHSKSDNLALQQSAIFVFRPSCGYQSTQRQQVHMISQRGPWANGGNPQRTHKASLCIALMHYEHQIYHNHHCPYTMSVMIQWNISEWLKCVEIVSSLYVFFVFLKLHESSCHRRRAFGFVRGHANQHRAANAEPIAPTLCRRSPGQSLRGAASAHQICLSQCLTSSPHRQIISNPSFLRQPTSRVRTLPAGRLPCFSTECICGVVNSGNAC